MTQEPPPYPGDDPGLPSYGSVPPPPGAGGTPPPPPPPPSPSGPAQNQKALAALIVGLVSIPLTCCPCVGVGTGITSLVLGILGRREIAASGGTQDGDGMALAGIVIGILAIIVSIVMTILGIALNVAEFESATVAS